MFITELKSLKVILACCWAKSIFRGRLHHNQSQNVRAIFSWEPLMLIENIICSQMLLVYSLETLEKYGKWVFREGSVFSSNCGTFSWKTATVEKINETLEKKINDSCLIILRSFMIPRWAWSNHIWYSGRP